MSSSTLSNSKCATSLRSALSKTGVVIEPSQLDETKLRKKSLNVALLGILSRHLDFSVKQWNAAIRRCLPRKPAPSESRGIFPGEGGMMPAAQPVQFCFHPASALDYIQRWWLWRSRTGQAVWRTSWQRSKPPLSMSNTCTPFLSDVATTRSWFSALIIRMLRFSNC